MNTEDKLCATLVCIMAHKLANDVMNHLRLNQAIHSLGKNRQAFAQTIENTVQTVCYSRMNVASLLCGVCYYINGIVTTVFIKTVDQCDFFIPKEDFMLECQVCAHNSIQFFG